MSILPFKKPHDGAFDPEATLLLGEAFDSIHESLGTCGARPAYEEAASRIIDAVRRGERDPARLREAGLGPHNAA